MEEREELVPDTQETGSEEAGSREAESRNTGAEDKADFLRRDAEAFRQRFPDVELGQLEQSASFRRFCGSRLYEESVVGLYEDYLAFVSEAEEKAASRRADRRSRSTGSGSGRGGSGLTVAQQEALEEWNAAFPGMRMSAKEFLSR